MELRFPIFTFCTGQRHIPVVNERKFNNVKKNIALKNTSIHFSGVYFTLLISLFLWLSVSTGGFLCGRQKMSVKGVALVGSYTGRVIYNTKDI